MSESLRATPFHGRAAAANRCNRWTTRNHFTVAQDFGDAQGEALAARTNVVIADISWRWRLSVEGKNAGEFLARAVTRDARNLQPGESFKALWLNDGGAVRGAGVIARYASDKFLVVAAAGDMPWFSAAASAYGVNLRDVSEADGGVAVVGSYAAAVLQAAGLEADMAPLMFRKLFWRGLDVTISRWGEQDGFEIWCASEDCFLLWDRLMTAGARYAIRPAGADAADILDIEAGVPRPARDYRAACDGFTAAPAPDSLGLESLIDEQHGAFNGRAGWLACRGTSKTVLVGMEIDSQTCAPFATLSRNGHAAGHTLTSVHSPGLRRAIALAQVDRSMARAGTEFSLALPIDLHRPEHRVVAARVAPRPFIETPPAVLP